MSSVELTEKEVTDLVSLLTEGERTEWDEYDGLDSGISRSIAYAGWTGSDEDSSIERMDVFCTSIDDEESAPSNYTAYVIFKSGKFATMNIYLPSYCDDECDASCGGFDVHPIEDLERIKESDMRSFVSGALRTIMGSLPQDRALEMVLQEATKVINDRVAKPIF